MTMAWISADVLYLFPIFKRFGTSVFFLGRYCKTPPKMTGWGIIFRISEFSNRFLSGKEEEKTKKAQGKNEWFIAGRPKMGFSLKLFWGGDNFSTWMTTWASFEIIQTCFYSPQIITFLYNGVYYSNFFACGANFDYCFIIKFHSTLRYFPKFSPAAL